MRELVSEQTLGSVVRAGVRVHEAVVDEDREGRVLHPAEREVAHDRLRVLRPRVLHAGGLREERHHRGQVPERVVDLRALTLRDVVLEGDPLPHRFCTVELAAHNRNEVVYVGDILEPVEGPRLPRRVVLLVHQAAVRDRDVRIVHGDDDLGRHPLVRRVVRREPGAVVLLFPLRPHHVRVLRICLRGVDEEHPLPGLAVVGNLQGEFGVRLVGPPEADRELRAAVVEFERAPLAVRHLPDVEVFPIQLDLAQPVVQGAQGQRRGPADLLLCLVQKEIETDVADAKRAIPREVLRGGLLCEDLVGRADVVCPAEQKGLRRTPPRRRLPLEFGRVI